MFSRISHDLCMGPSETKVVPSYSPCSVYNAFLCLFLKRGGPKTIF